MSSQRLLSFFSEHVKDSSLTNFLLRYNPAYYKRALRTVRQARAETSESDIAVSGLLARAISWARETEYGRQFGPRLEDWPILTKNDVLADPKRFSRAQRFPVPVSTGGSSGQPLRLWRSLQCIAAEQAVIDSLLGPGNSPMLRRRVAVLRADYVKDPADQDPPYGVMRNGNRWLVLSNAHLSRRNLHWFIKELTSFRPELLWVYPTALSNLLRLLDECGAKLTVPTVLSSSERLSPSLYEFAEKALRANVIDRYGQGEYVCSAHCTANSEYWFDRGYGHVELVPLPHDMKSDAPAAARIIATGYWNSAFPLIRYDTGDHAILPESTDLDSLELIAQGKQPFLGILGRSDDYIKGRDGELITGMNHIPRNLDSVLRIQIIQDNLTTVRILVLARGQLEDNDRQVLERNARMLIPPYIDLHIVQAEELLKSPNGKTPFIIRKIDDDSNCGVNNVT